MKIEISDFTYTASPGHLVIDELEARDLDYSDFVKAMGENAPTREALLTGEFAITPEIAEKIGTFLETPPRMWLKFEESFRQAIAAGKPVLNPERPEKKRGLNGKILLRVPTSLHCRVAKLAKAEGISLNQLLLSYVAEGIGRSERA